MKVNFISLISKQLMEGLLIKWSSGRCGKQRHLLSMIRSHSRNAINSDSIQFNQLPSFWYCIVCSIWHQIMTAAPRFFELGLFFGYLLLSARLSSMIYVSESKNISRLSILQQDLSNVIRNGALKGECIFLQIQQIGLKVY